MKAVSAPKTERRRKLSRKIQQQFDGDMLLKLYELLQGEREMVKVYSKALKTHICFVNPARRKSPRKEPDCPVYTTRELSFVLSMSPEELRRYHYLKTCLV